MGDQARLVAGASAADLEGLSRLIRTAGAWEFRTFTLENEFVIGNADAIVVHTRTAVADPLSAKLRERGSRTALIVIGGEPCPKAKPTLWLAQPPSPGLLANVLGHYVRERATTNPPVWRRKGDMIIGHSPAVRQLLATLDQLAPAQTPVIITGESGVGKELVARALHYTGPRAAAPFIAINCAAIPENLIEAELFGYQRGAFTGAVAAHAGAIEAANKGTLFLDEIGEMPLPMQAKLLRVLQTSEVQRIGSTERKKVDFRLVSATNRDLEAEVAAGRFREDLYYRIQVYPLHIAPLRERVEDIPAIAAHYLSQICDREHRPEIRLTNGAIEKLLAYAWPGNVRELVNLLERAVLVAGGSVIDADHLLFPRTRGDTRPLKPAILPYRDAKQQFELDYYSQLMRTAGGNISLAAKIGHKTRKEVYDALKRLEVDVSSFRDDEEEA